MSDDKPKNIRAGGLWLNETKSGDKYFSGSMGAIRISIFKNGFKEEGTNQPDYIMYFGEQMKKEENGAAEKETAEPKENDVPF